MSDSIFISYARQDAKVSALRIRRDLQLAGFTQIFLDLDPREGISPGEPWKEELKRKSRGCGTMLVLVSPAWLASRWGRQEFAWAYAEWSKDRRYGPKQTLSC